MRLTDDQLHGRTVIASDGVAVGEIVALFLDSTSWRVDAIELELRKEIADRLGAHRSIFRAGALEVPTSLIQSVGDAVVLSVAVDELRQVLPGAGESAPAH